MCGAQGGIYRVNTFFSPSACCFLYKAKHLSSPSYRSSAVVGGECSASRLGRFTPGERAYWIGSWLDLRVGLHHVEKRKILILPGLELRPLGHPARSQGLYRLRYPKKVKQYFAFFNFKILYIWCKKNQRENCLLIYVDILKYS
jgi:hypothetical protein